MSQINSCESQSESRKRQEVMRALFERYKEVALASGDALSGLGPRCQSAALAALCQEAMDNGEKYPFDKMNRWLGFTQGVLAAVGAIDVDLERDFTRPLLHSLHEGAIPTYATPAPKGL